MSVAAVMWDKQADKYTQKLRKNKIKMSRILHKWILLSPVSFRKAQKCLLETPVNCFDGLQARPEELVAFFCDS